MRRVKPVADDPDADKKTLYVEQVCKERERERERKKERERERESE